MKKYFLFIIIMIFINWLIFCTKNSLDKPALKDQMIDFSYKPENPVQSVYLSGDFNSWRINDTEYKMILQENGNYQISVKKQVFKQGKNYYVFIVDGKWIPDQNSTEKVDRGFAGKVSVLQLN